MTAAWDDETWRVAECWATLRIHRPDLLRRCVVCLEIHGPPATWPCGPCMVARGRLLRLGHDPDAGEVPPGAGRAETPGTG